MFHADRGGAFDNTLVDELVDSFQKKGVWQSCSKKTPTNLRQLFVEDRMIHPIDSLAYIGGDTSLQIIGINVIHISRNSELWKTKIDGHFTSRYLHTIYIFSNDFALD